eukprot:TRINITY_DN15728_c0_g1_i1.p1 TRINITY_DN15728_c0_g1~~TRINITY_DN15728_c0_g1_i1.p1  ORF type:complete len:149 (-),score=5.90 TRINITY_DN15728_c0_g1_i1:56-502(-)
MDTNSTHDVSCRRAHCSKVGAMVLLLGAGLCGTLMMSKNRSQETTDPPLSLAGGKSFSDGETFVIRQCTVCGASKYCLRDQIDQDPNPRWSASDSPFHKTIDQNTHYTILADLVADTIRFCRRCTSDCGLEKLERYLSFQRKKGWTEK